MSDGLSPAAQAGVRAAARVCMNCGAPLGGAYCAACGQEARIETPTVGEFVREFVQDQMALEGKLWRTLKLLLTRPGALTLDYIAGKRQCYIRPLRLYLALSVLFFGVTGLVGHPDWLQPGPGEDDKPLIDAGPKAATPADTQATPPTSADQHSGGAAKEQPKGDAAKRLDDKEDVMRELMTGYPLLDSRIRKYFSQTQKQAGAQLAQAVYNDAPVAMFFLLPLFAGLLQLVYLRHHLRYGVHLLSALHFHAFVFLDLLLQQIPWPWIIRVPLKLAIPLYLVLALRRVYGGRLWTTALAVAALLLVYMLLIGLTLFAAAVVSIIING
ncbi:MAG: DUF3667 domain-containing protein [Nevskia sp.]|nr:DUF3667 domain-containing protein [Nevskia sp.]